MMGMRFKRPAVRRTLAAAAALAVAGGVVVALRLRATVERALAPAPLASTPLRFVAVSPARRPLDHWGGPAVESVAFTPSGLLVAGASGLGLVRAEGRSELSGPLPGLAISALALWRGEAVVALKSGGLFRRRDGQWQEMRSGWGALDVRALAETDAGELLIGARQGLFRAAWEAGALERLDVRPVRSIAVGRDVLLAGGEEGLHRVEAGRVRRLQTSDPWIDGVALLGGEAWAVTPAGLLRGDVRGESPLSPVAGGEDVVSGVAVDGVFYGLDTAEGSVVRRFSGGRLSEDLLPSPARRLLASGGLLFADTADGLYRREAGGWKRAAPRAATLPPGPSHVTSLAFLGGNLVAGLFDGGLVVGRPRGEGFEWQAVPGSAAWGVNALLPAGGALYVASLRGAARFDGRTLTPLEGPGAAFSLAATDDGVAIGYGQGVLLPGPRLLSGFHGLPGNQALALVSGESLFVGTPSGLGAIGDRRVRWRVAQGEGKLPHPWVTALLVSQDALYVGTYGGGVVRRRGVPTEAPIARVDGARYEPFVETEGFKVNTGCLVEAEGRVYAGTDGGGLYRLSPDRARFERLPLALPSQRITALLPASGALVVGTDEGIARVRLRAANGASGERMEELQ